MTHITRIIWDNQTVDFIRGPNHPYKTYYIPNMTRSSKVRFMRVMRTMEIETLCSTSGGGLSIFYTRKG